MLIDLETMKKIHKIQIEMMKELIKVMDVLKIRYFFVHGSLLGAITREGFIEEDDDIDIAIFRDDYNRLLSKGNKYLPSKYFLQNSLNDDFPLAFAKMRNSETAFIQPVLDKCKCNKGIYIDIFPIDYISKSKNEKLQEKILGLRINSRLSYKKKISLKRLICICVAYVLFPSYKRAIKIREFIYSSREKNEYVDITNGKFSEKKISLNWFGEGVKKRFCGIEVVCPLEYNDYLKKVYGDRYLEVNPAMTRIKANGLTEISAKILDFNKSYKYYE